MMVPCHLNRSGGETLEAKKRQRRKKRSRPSTVICDESKERRRRECIIMKQGLATECSFFFPLSPAVMEIRTRWCHCVLEGIGEISSTARQTVCQNFMAISFKATITDHLVHYHGRHRTEFKDFFYPSSRSILSEITGTWAFCMDA